MIKVTKDPATEIVPVENHTAVLTPMDMLNRAVQSGADMSVLEKLMDLHDRYEKSQARKAFDNAIAAAKSEIPVIEKKRTASFTMKDGGNKSYSYEDMAIIAETIDPILSKHGLSYRYRSTQEGATVTVTCIVSHRDGHFEETSLSAANDPSGNKNAIQAIGSAISYLQRYSLKLALGLAAAKDDDAKQVGFEPISPEQLDELLALADEVGAEKAAFCRWAKVDSFADIAAKNFDKAKKALEAKRRAPK